MPRTLHAPYCVLTDNTPSCTKGSGGSAFDVCRACGAYREAVAASKERRRRRRWWWYQEQIASHKDCPITSISGTLCAAHLCRVPVYCMRCSCYYFAAPLSRLTPVVVLVTARSPCDYARSPCDHARSPCNCYPLTAPRVPDGCHGNTMDICICLYVLICIYLLIYSTYVYVAHLLLAHCFSVAHLLLAYCSPKLHELELGQSVATEKLSLEVRNTRTCYQKSVLCLTLACGGCSSCRG